MNNTIKHLENGDFEVIKSDSMKCSICNKQATGRYSPDLDINGIGFCKEHEESVQIAYYLLINEGEESFNKYLRRIHQK